MSRSTTLPRPARRRGLTRALMLSAALVASSALAPPALAQAHPLRGAADFVPLEDALLAAMRSRDTAKLEALLADDFEMVVSALPLDSITRDAWIENLARPGSTDVEIRSLTTRPAAPDLAQVSFWLVPAAGKTNRGNVFVIDTWRRDGERWRVISRYAAPVAGSRLWIPGDSGRPPFRKAI